jgi:hypothetical protein
MRIAFSNRLAPSYAVTSGTEGRPLARKAIAMLRTRLTDITNLLSTAKSRAATRIVADNFFAAKSNFYKGPDIRMHGGEERRAMNFLICNLQGISLRSICIVKVMINFSWVAYLSSVAQHPVGTGSRSALRPVLAF